MPHSSLRPSQRLAPRGGQYWSITPTTPRESRKASSSSPKATIFFGGPSASGNSSDSKTGIQNRRSNSPIGVPEPLSVRNLLSSARSMERPPVVALGRAWRRRDGASTCVGQPLRQTSSDRYSDGEFLAVIWIGRISRDPAIGEAVKSGKTCLGFIYDLDHPHCSHLAVHWNTCGVHFIPAPEQHESAYLLPENVVDG